MISIAICDDDKIELRAAAHKINRYSAINPDFRIRTELFEDSAVLYDIVDNGERFDVYILDVLMPEPGGMEIARLIRENDKNAKIIFLTISKDFALDAFSVNASQYLLKPVAEDELFSAIDGAVRTISSGQAQSLLVKTSDGQVKLMLKSIIYAEINGHVIQYHIDGEKTVQSKFLRVSFEDAVSPLLSDGRFIRPHNSFMVNMTRIFKYSSLGLTMDDGSFIPVSKARRAATKAAYLKYLSDSSVLMSDNEF